MMAYRSEDKLAELKEMLIGWKILKNTSVNDWNEYKRKINFDFSEKEGMMALLTEEAVDLMVDKSEKEVLNIFDDFIFSSSVSSQEVQCLLVRLCTSVSDRIGQGGHWWHRHRVLCWLMMRVLERYKLNWSDDTVDCFGNYLVKVIECDEMEMVTWAMLAGEWCWIKMKLNSDRRDQMPTALTRHSTNTDTLHLIKCCRHYGYWFMKPIRTLFFNYLTRTLTSTTDQWTQLFVLNAFRDLEMSDKEKSEIEACEKIVKMVDSWRNEIKDNEKCEDVVKLLNSEHDHRMHHQLYHYSHNLLSTEPTPSISNSLATLDQSDHSHHLSLSPCRMSARSDWEWQSVRSVCQISAHIFYFEAVLLTSGPMTIGWATKRTELYRKEVGSDEFSLGLDGFNRWFRHENEQQQLEGIPRWKAGDVIGCLLDHANRQFSFSLNGQPILINIIPYFSSLPYHACVSLSPHQQVYFNFGQASFKHRPKRIDFRDFYHYPLKDLIEKPPSRPCIIFHNSNFSESLISIDSQVSIKDFTIHDNFQPSTSSSSSYIDDRIQHFKRSVYPILCQTCESPMSTKRLRFECCDHLKFCRNCAAELGDCLKCKARKNQ